MNLALIALVFGVAGFLILWFSTGRSQLVGVAVLGGAVTAFLLYLARL